MNILEIPLIAGIRRNHALEHATIHVLTEHNPQRYLVGRTTPSGFYIFGEVEIEEVAAAVSEALLRLQRGEHSLAIHPRCGTNLATAGVLAGLSSFVAMSGPPKSRLAKLPRILLAATIAVIAAQPLGLALQKHVTTLPEVEGVTIEEITRLQKGQVVAHQVRTKSQ
jgi:hypothetical protein